MDRSRVARLLEMSGRKTGFDPLERLTRGRPQDDSEAEKWFNSDRLVALKNIEEKLTQASMDLKRVLPGILSSIESAKANLDHAKDLLKKPPEHVPPGVYDKGVRKLEALDLNTKAMTSAYRDLVAKIDQTLKTASDVLDPYKGA